MRGQEDRARVGHALQALLGHREDADLVDRAEAVLDGAHQAKAAVRVALEIQHRVDDVLEHARPGQRAVLGDMADEHHAGAADLGMARELRRAFAHLRHRARRRGQLLGVQRLDRIDDAEVRRLGLQREQDLLQLDLGQHAHLLAVQPEPARAQRHLRAAFLAGDVQHAHLPRQAVGRLQQQRALADAGVAADQHHAAADDAAAERAVELVLAGGRARHVGDDDLAQRGHRLRAAQATGSGAVDGGLRRALPAACSRRRNAGICPATSGCCRRIRCRCTSSCPWPWRRLSPAGLFGLLGPWPRPALTCPRCALALQPAQLGGVGRLRRPPHARHVRRGLHHLRQPLPARRRGSSPGCGAAAP